MKLKGKRRRQCFVLPILIPQGQWSICDNLFSTSDFLKSNITVWDLPLACTSIWNRIPCHVLWQQNKCELEKERLLRLIFWRWNTGLKRGQKLPSFSYWHENNLVKMTHYKKNLNKKSSFFATNWHQYRSRISTPNHSIA